MTDELHIQDLARDIVVANVQGHFVPNEELQAMLRQTIVTLKTSLATTEAASMETEIKTLGSWRNSITQHSITCLICNKSFKSLSVHLRLEHQMNTSEYRKQFGIPAKTSLSSKMLSAKRRKIARESGAGERLKKAREARRAAR